jgi:crotonobetainyl-CoA:carnitine CoA-transferase CaiB-like acyl-CoA transferase
VLRECRSRTFAELSSTFDKHGVWYTIVRSPGQALCYEQAVQTKSFRSGVVNEGAKFVNSPLQFN